MDYPKAQVTRAVILALMLTLFLAGAPPAQAQTDTDQCQYAGDCPAGAPVTELDPRRFVDPVIKGSSALAGALSGEPNASEHPSEKGSTTSSGSSSRPDIEVLPDTGGAPVSVLAGGLVLVAAGFAVRRVVR